MIFSTAHVSNLRAFHDTEPNVPFLPAGTTKRSEPSERFPSTCFSERGSPSIDPDPCCDAMTGAAEHCILCWEAPWLMMAPMADVEDIWLVDSW